MVTDESEHLSSERRVVLWEYSLGGPRFQCLLRGLELLVLRNDEVLAREHVPDLASAWVRAQAVHARFLPEILDQVKRALEGDWSDDPGAS